MGFETIVLSQHQHWVEIALNRPEVHNALNQQMLTELLSAFEKVSKDGRIHCIVLTGNGKAFCSGQDLKAIDGGFQKIPFSDIVRTQYVPLIKKIRGIELPVICKLNGIAAGAGCSLALASDIIVTSRESYLVESFIHIGLVMDAGSTYFLPKLVGERIAFEMATTGRKIYGEEAERIGLVNKCVEEGELDECVKQYVDIYCSSPKKAMGLMKKMLYSSSQMSLEDVLEMEARFQQEAGSSPDFEEGVRAFLEKRKPDFRKDES